MSEIQKICVREMLMDILRDPVWQFVGVIVSLIALVLTALPIFLKTPVQLRWITPPFLKGRKFLFTALAIETIVLIVSLLAGSVTVFQQNSSMEHNRMLATITSRSPDLDDPLNANDRGYQWDEKSTCVFQGGAYHVISSPDAGEGCLSNALTVRNFVFTATMKVLKGNEGALIFRFKGQTHPTSNYYYFYIKIDNRAYGLTKYTSKGQTLTQTNLYDFFSPDITLGLLQPNDITVLAKDGTIDLFINQKYTYEITDQNFLSEGTLGFGDGPASEVVFTQAKMWKL